MFLNSICGVFKSHLMGKLSSFFFFTVIVTLVPS